MRLPRLQVRLSIDTMGEDAVSPTLDSQRPSCHDMEDRQQPDARPTSRESHDLPPEKTMPRIEFDQIAHGSTEVLIEHNGQVYRLRATRNGKLILNK